MNGKDIPEAGRLAEAGPYASSVHTERTVMFTMPLRKILFVCITFFLVRSIAAAADERADSPDTKIIVTNFVQAALPLMDLCISSDEPYTALDIYKVILNTDEECASAALALRGLRLLGELSAKKDLVNSYYIYKSFSRFPESKTVHEVRDQAKYIVHSMGMEEAPDTFELLLQGVR